jgi:tetratricopeptide (TPR) repeat protein
MNVDPNQETIPSPAVRRISDSPLGRFVRSVPGAFLILAVILGTSLTLAAVAGYYAGSSERERAAATAQFTELNRQYQLAVDDMNAGRYGLAIQRLEFILSLDPAFPNAANQLAVAQAAVPVGAVTTVPETTALPTPTLVITVGPETARNLLAEAQTAYDAGDWDVALQKVGALRVIDPTYEGATVRGLLFNSLRNRGIDYINAGKLELGLADIDQASRVDTLDTEAQQYQQWATIYIAGTSYWGLNWQRTVETFELLYTIAPYFRDTMTRLHDAYLAHALQLDALGLPCDAVGRYAQALDMEFDQLVEDKRAAADIACQFGTPTPDGTLTPFPTPDGTLTPFPPDGSVPSDTPDPNIIPTETPVV